jgi:hypothetical protein
MCSPPSGWIKKKRKKERKEETHDHDDLLSSSIQILVQIPSHCHWNRDEELLVR